MLKVFISSKIVKLNPCNKWALDGSQKPVVAM